MIEVNDVALLDVFKNGTCPEERLAAWQALRARTTGLRFGQLLEADRTKGLVAANVSLDPENATVVQ